MNLLKWPSPRQAEARAHVQSLLDERSQLLEAAGKEEEPTSEVRPLLSSGAVSFTRMCQILMMMSPVQC